MPSRKSDFNHCSKPKKVILITFFSFSVCTGAKVISITFLLSVPSRKSDFNHFFPLAVFVCGSLGESLGKRGIEKSDFSPSLKLDHFFQSLFSITFFDHFFRSLFSITFSDHFFRSLLWITFFDHFFRSLFSITFFSVMQLTSHIHTQQEENK